MVHARRVQLVRRLVGCLRAQRKGREQSVTELNATRDDIPNVSSAGINGSAKMVWQAVRATDSFVKYASPGKLQGIPGKYWQGAVNQIINELWPALNDRYLTEKDQAEDLKLALNRFLKYNRAMVCTRDGGLIKKSMWFVAEHWPELTVTPGVHQGAKSVESEVSDVVSDEAATSSPTTVGTSAVTPLDVFNLKRPVATLAPATEERSEEAMTPTFQEPITDAVPADEDDVVKHECRLDGCDISFDGVHHRATHEMKHGFRYNEDGTVTQFDPNSPTPDEEETQDLIIKFHERIGKDAEPLNQSQIVEGVRKATPKALSPTIKIVLQVMADEGWFEVINKVEGQKGRVRRFRYLGEPVKKARKSAKTVAQAVEEKVDALTNQDSGGFIETAVTTLRGETDGNRVERYQGLFQDLLADLEELNNLKAELAKERFLKEDLQRNLDAVIKQRDELQGKLDTLKQVFGSTLQ